jgi:RluA family pseudouridine synthase
VVTGKEEGLRLDLFLTGALPHTSRKEAKRLTDAHRVSVNGRMEPMASRLLHGGDRVSVSAPSGEPEVRAAEETLAVLYEDSACFAVAKPAGLPSGPTRSGREKHAGVLAEELASCALTLLHRLDKETSGALLLAKTPEFAETLLSAFRERRVEKVYLAVVRGRAPASFSSSCQLREVEGGRVQIVREGGAHAETEFRNLASRGGYSLLECRPKTGRMHQIRVQLAHAGYSLLGDSLYRGDAAARVAGTELRVRRHMLHAWKLRFHHPALGRMVQLTAPLPPDFRILAERLFGRPLPLPADGEAEGSFREPT